QLRSKDLGVPQHDVVAGRRSSQPIGKNELYRVTGILEIVVKVATGEQTVFGDFMVDLGNKLPHVDIVRNRVPENAGIRLRRQRQQAIEDIFGDRIQTLNGNLIIGKRLARQ